MRNHKTRLVTVLPLAIACLFALMPSNFPARAFARPVRQAKRNGAQLRFEDFPAGPRFKGKPAPVKIVTREARQFRTMLREGAAEGPNFAGHYTVVTWGCGGGCVKFGIVDAITGSVYMPSFYVAVVAPADVDADHIPDPVQFKIDSNLLIATGARNEKGNGTYYYKWEKNQLTLIKAIEAPQQ